MQVDGYAIMINKVELELIQEALKNVKEAGFGEVVIKVTDHKVVNIKYEAQRGLSKQERGGNNN